MLVLNMHIVKVGKYWRVLGPFKIENELIKQSKTILMDKSNVKPAILSYK